MLENQSFIHINRDYCANYEISIAAHCKGMLGNEIKKYQGVPYVLRTQEIRM